jgi:hypothetical protein
VEKSNENINVKKAHATNKLLNLENKKRSVRRRKLLFWTEIYIFFFASSIYDQRQMNREKRNKKGQKNPHGNDFHL